MKKLKPMPKCKECAEGARKLNNLFKHGHPMGRKGRKK
jgi:hypothetical protein